MNFPTLIVGVLALGITWAWVMSDWRVRSARSVALLLASLVALVGASLLIEPPAGMIVGVGLGALIAAPVILRLPAVMPLERRDAEMTQRIADIERQLVNAGRRFRDNRLTVAGYRQSLEEIRAGLRRLNPTDDAWGRVLSAIEADVTGSISKASGLAGAAGDAQAHRAEVRRIHTAVVRERLRFWR